MKCRIYEARPEQCRLFPNTWNYEGFEHICNAHRIIPDAAAPSARAARPAAREYKKTGGLEASRFTYGLAAMPGAARRLHKSYFQLLPVSSS